MNRAYAILSIKAVDDDKRIITGTATTPTPDRVGDIVDPLGVRYKNPMPLLWMHRSSEPVGEVRFDKPTKNGITFTARMPKPTLSEDLKRRVDEAWESVKLGLVRAVSIGFRSLEHSFMDDGGIHFMETEVLELSLVTIPAQSDATIDAVKSIDGPVLAATGLKPSDDDRPKKKAGDSARRPITVKAQEGTKMKRKTIAEQIAGFEATRAAKAARMGEIMDEAGEKGETLDESQQQEYDGLDAEIKAVDEHLVRLRAHEKTVVASAAPATGAGPAEASQARAGIRVEVKSALPKGIAFTRFVIAKYVGAREMISPIEIAKERWPDMPELQVALKAAVAAGTTSNMSALVEPQIMASEFIEYLWHKTIVGRIPGLRRVPFNIKIQRQTAVAGVNWVGEGKPKPLGRGTLDTVTLGYYKIAGIVGLTDELVRFSSPAAEAMVRDELSNGIVQLMDHDFLDPEKAAVAGVSPASISNGVTGVAATGTAYANVAADVASALGNFDAARIDTSDLVVVMNSRIARMMSLMLNSLGQRLFPDLTNTGGTFLGYPVVVSNNVDYTEDSPAEGDSIFFIKPSEILLADDGAVTIDISREASVQMDSAPDDPASASTVLISAFQHNLVLIRAERYVNWLKRRDAALQYIKAAKYA